MGAKYEIWLTDDRGVRMHLFSNIAYFSYSRSTVGLGTFQMGIPFEDFRKKIPAIFRPDWRIDIWRSPGPGIPARREGSFLLRKFIVYERTTDRVIIIEFFGRSPLDLLRRQPWKTTDVFTDRIDNIMRYIVSGRFVTNQTAYSTSPNTLSNGVYTSTGEFAVDGPAGNGPITSGTYYLKNVLDILNDLKAESITLNIQSSSNKKIYFDVIEDDSLISNGFGYRFRTYADLRGTDRTSGTIFSSENGNMSGGNYYEDYIDQITSVFMYNSQQAWGSQNSQTDDQYLSRWNYIEDVGATNQELAAGALADANSILKTSGSQKLLNADFLNSPGSLTQPRSLYGIDWDMGDLLPVRFAGKDMEVEVVIVYVSLNDKGQEKITGKSSVGV